MDKVDKPTHVPNHETLPFTRTEDYVTVHIWEHGVISGLSHVYLLFPNWIHVHVKFLINNIEYSLKISLKCHF